MERGRGRGPAETRRRGFPVHLASTTPYVRRPPRGFLHDVFELQHEILCGSQSTEAAEQLSISSAPTDIPDEEASEQDLVEGCDERCVSPVHGHASGCSDDNIRSVDSDATVWDRTFYAQRNLPTVPFAIGSDGCADCLFPNGILSRISFSEAAILINGVLSLRKSSSYFRDTLCLLITSLLPGGSRMIDGAALDRELRRSRKTLALKHVFLCNECSCEVFSARTPCTNCDRRSDRYPGSEKMLRHTELVFLDHAIQIDLIVSSYHCLMERHCSPDPLYLLDLKDGRIMREHLANRDSRTDPMRLMFMLQTDGVAKDRSSGSHAWPINLFCCNLPAALREQLDCVVVSALALCFVAPALPVKLLLDTVFSSFDSLFSTPRTVVTTCCGSSVAYYATIGCYASDIIARQDLLRLGPYAQCGVIVMLALNTVLNHLTWD